MAAAATSLLETEMSAVLILDEERRTLKVAASEGVDPEIAAGLATPLGDNLAGRVAQTGKPIRCIDVPADSRSQLSAVEDAGICSAMLAPLAHHGEVIGVLSVETHERRRFSHREQSVLQLLANQAASAIEKAGLYALERGHVDELKAMVDRINSQNTVMRRSRDAHERLTQVALQGLGAGALVETTSDLVAAPVALVNRYGCLTASAPPGGDGQIEELWGSLRDSRAFKEQIDRLRDDPGSAESELLAEAGRWRIFAAVASGEVLGFVIAFDHESLEEADIVVLEQSANIIATELLRERSVAEAEARMHGDLLTSLLAGSTPDSELQERAALLGHDLAAAQCVVVARCDDGESSAAEPVLASSAAAWASASRGLRSVAGCVNGQIVGLLRGGDRALGRDTVEGWISDLGERLSALGVTADLRFGVSPVVEGGSQVGEAWQTANQALAVGVLDGGATVTHFDDVELIATLVAAAERGLLSRFVGRCIGRIVDYDSKRGSSLAETLEVYLDRSRVARHAAKDLYLHPHSLRYRLRRIDEIQGVDLDDPNERLMTHLALKLRSFV